MATTLQEEAKATNTVNGIHSAEETIDKMLATELNLGPIRTLPFAVIAGLGLRMLFFKIFDFFSDNFIPEYWTGTFEPTATNKKKFLKWNTLAGYIGKMFQLLRELHPLHEDFEGLKKNIQPEWYTIKLGNFKKVTQIKQQQATLNDDITFGNVKKVRTSTATAFLSSDHQAQR